MAGHCTTAGRRKLRPVTARPVITLTTDFGTADHYVAAMKAVLLAACPAATLVDVTHHVPRQDVTAGAFTLERAVAAFGPGVVHLAVVDPGVGTARRLLVADVAGSTVVCPDNGLITWAWRRHGGGAARELTWRPANASHTFHGRDVMAPVAGRIAAGEASGSPPVEPVLLDLHVADAGDAGVVIHIDHFGNATTNVPAERLGDAGRWHAAGVDVGPLRRTYADVAVGRPLALIGSSGLLEVAVRDGSAAGELGLRVGNPVALG